ncbi:MAG: hypothetical protein ACYS0I_18035 [Planctomycetota bacterium]|jgi:hypothetical protein
MRRCTRLLGLTLGTALYSLTPITPVYSGEHIEVTLRNFYELNGIYGKYKYSQMTEFGIPASEHILIIKSFHCLDNAMDKKGNEYYFYMVDRSIGLKALITTAELDPVEGLDDKIKEFHEVVKKEIIKDGGLGALIEKFKNH